MKYKSISKWFSMLLVMMVAGVTNAFGQSGPSLALDNFSIKAGETKTVAISLAGSAVYGIQADIALTEKLSLESVDKVTTNTNFKFETNVVDGKTRVALLSLKKDDAQIATGEVINLTVKAANDFTGGSITIDNIFLATNQTGTEVSPDGLAVEVSAIITPDAPVFDPAEGTYYAPRSVTITCATNGADIYYTTDGTTPSATNGTKYTEAISVTATTTIKAIAVLGTESSEAVSATYTIEELKFYAVGEPLTVFGGQETWTIYDANKLTKQSDNSYKIEYKDVELTAGTVIKCKVKTNSGVWIPDGGDETNHEITVESDGTYDIVITMTSAESTDIELTVTKQEPPVEYTYFILGAVGSESASGKDDVLFGKTWTISDDNQLTLDATSGKYTKTYENIILDKGDVEYKFIRQGTDNSQIWIPDGDNLKCAIDARGKYNLAVSFDAEQNTGTLTATLVEALPDVYVVAGSSTELFGTAWSVAPDNNPNTLTANATDATYTKTYSEVELSAGDIEYKIVKNGTTYYPAGDESTNLKCTIETAGTYNVTVTFFGEDANPVATMVANKKETPVAPDAPTFTPVAGTYSEAQQVTIACATAGADIYYTLDGTDPTANSSKYTEAITISETTTVKAIAILNELSSEVVSATYTIEAAPEIEHLYIIGTVNSWSLTDMPEMTFNTQTNAFEYDVTCTDKYYFAISDVATATDWGTFNAGNRYAIAAGDQDVTIGTEVQLIKANGAIVINGAGEYRISVTKDLKLTVTKTGDTPVVNYTYFVTGSSEAVFGEGSTWTVSADNQLTLDATSGKYTKVYENVVLNPGDIEYKFIKQGTNNEETWIPGDGQANLKCTIAERGKYTLTASFDAEQNTGTLTATLVEALADVYVAAGAIKIGNGAEQAGFFGTAWDASAAANEMTLSEGIYTKKFTGVEIADKTTVLAKVAVNGGWKWYPDGANMEYVVNGDGTYDVTITFNTTDNTATLDVAGMTGDSNLDGQVTTADAVLAVSIALEKDEVKDATYEQKRAANINGSTDGEGNPTITVSDAVGIVNIALEKDDATGGAPLFNAGENFLTLSGTTLNLTNSTTFVGFQMDVTLTNGAVLNGVQFADRAQGLKLYYNRVGENTWRIIGFSTENNAITGNEGSLLSFDITGSKTMTITNVEFADGNATAYTLGFNDGGTTGIQTIDNGQLTIDNVIYDLNGRRVQNPTKGVYVINGRKVVIK